MKTAKDEFCCGSAKINCVTKNNTSGNRTVLVQKRVSFYASFIIKPSILNSFDCLHWENLYREP